MARWLVLAAALAALLGLIASAGADPFTGKPDRPSEGPVAGVERAWGPVAVVGRALLTVQREANRLIAKHMRAIRDGETSVPLLIGIGLAFLYGVVHALGPGHGKLVVVSYFLSREARIGRGLLMGLQIAVFHVISAIIVVALADLLLRKAFGGPPAEIAGVRVASYALIALIGVTMLSQAIRRSSRRRAGLDVSHGCCGHGHEHQDGWVQLGALSLGVGVVPCTGAVLILLYAMANDILLAGVLLAAAIAAGMAITMSVLGILSVVARRAVAQRVGAHGDGHGRFAVAMDYGGALAITMVGSGLLWAALH